MGTESQDVIVLSFLILSRHSHIMADVFSFLYFALFTKQVHLTIYLVCTQEYELIYLLFLLLNLALTKHSDKHCGKCARAGKKATFYSSCQMLHRHLTDHIKINYVIVFRLD